MDHRFHQLRMTGHHFLHMHGDEGAEFLDHRRLFDLACDIPLTQRFKRSLIPEQFLDRKNAVAVLVCRQSGQRSPAKRGQRRAQRVEPVGETERNRHAGGRL